MASVQAMFQFQSCMLANLSSILSTAYYLIKSLRYSSDLENLENLKMSGNLEKTVKVTEKSENFFKLLNFRPRIVHFYSFQRISNAGILAKLQ